jgi:chaperonin GroEL (HSP60 family)
VLSSWALSTQLSPYVLTVVQVGDGTTTVVILSGELLRAAKPFVEEGVHPRVSDRVLGHACLFSTHIHITKPCVELQPAVAAPMLCSL